MIYFNQNCITWLSAARFDAGSSYSYSSPHGLRVLRCVSGLFIAVIFFAGRAMPLSVPGTHPKGRSVEQSYKSVLRAAYS
jgi:hypothetical protein